MAVPDLIELLREGRDDGYGPAVIEALGRIGPDAAPAVPFLIERFRKQECFLGKQGTFVGSNYGQPSDALARIGAPAVPALVEVMNGPNAEVRPCAAEVLARIGPSAEGAVPALIRAVQPGRLLGQDADLQASVLQRHALFALCRIGPRAAAVIPMLNEKLDREIEADVSRKNEPPSDRWSNVGLLAQVGAPPIEKLLGAFRRGAVTAADELSYLGPLARPAVPALRDALNDQRPEIRVSAALALAFIDPSVTEVVPILIDGLENHREESDAMYAPEALARLGPSAKAAIPLLLSFVSQGIADADIIKALIQIDPEGEQCLPMLIRALEDEEPETVEAAAQSLRLLGPRAKAAIPALTTVLAHHYGLLNDNPQVGAAKALGRIDPEARSVLPALIASLKDRGVVRVLDGDEEGDPDYSAAEAAAEVLGSLGARARDAVPALIEAVESRVKENENWQLRQAAALALGRIGPDARPAIPTLRRIAAEKQSPVTDAAAIALYRLDPAEEARVEDLFAALIKPRWGSGPTETMRAERLATLKGGLGRASLEGEFMTRRWLEPLDRMIPRDGRIRGDYMPFFLEGYFERIASFGVGAQVAIPRMEELLRHPNPWIRLWSGETLARIRPAARAVRKSAPETGRRRIGSRRPRIGEADSAGPRRTNGPTRRIGPPRYQHPAGENPLITPSRSCRAVDQVRLISAR